MSSVVARSTPAGSTSSLHVGTTESQPHTGVIQKNNSDPQVLSSRIDNNPTNFNAVTDYQEVHDTYRVAADLGGAQAIGQHQLLGAVSRLPPTSQSYHETRSMTESIPEQQAPRNIISQHKGQSHNLVGVQQQSTVVSQPQVNYNILPPHIQSQIDEFRSGNQIHARQHAAPTGDIQIGHLRADPNLRHSADVGLNAVLENIPSLSTTTPQRTVSFNLPSNHGVDPSSVEQNPTSEGVYEWVMDRNGSRHLVHRSNHQIHVQTHEYSPHTALPQPNIPTRREYRCSPNSGRLFTVEVPIELEHDNQFYSQQQSTQYRMEYRCCPVTGRVWQEKVRVDPSPPRPSFIWEWRVDPRTGQRFQVKVQASPGVSSVNSVRPINSRQVFSVGSSNTGASLDSSVLQPGKYGLHNEHSMVGADNRSLNMTGITRIDKNGKRGHRLVDLAKQCPAKWSKQTTSNSISMPLYMWASVSELEAALSGRSQQIHESELIGKLRHIKHTLEVCCLNSSSTEFTGYGWLIAKDYALKVEEEVANGLVDWSDLQAGLRTNTLVLSQMDCPRQASNKLPKKDSDKQLCTTYNKCTTSGKCDYEVANPGRSCQRRHECSWCRQKLGQGNKHQERECRKKNDNGD